MLKTLRLDHAVVLLVLLLGLATAAHAAEEDAPTKAYKKAYRFTVNTFTDKISLWSNLLAEFKGKPNLNYLEIGTFEGRSALWILENVLTHPTAKLTIIDAFEEHSRRTFDANVKLSGEAEKFTVLSGPSIDKVRELPFNTYDLAYIDGSGKGIVMFSDLVSTWNLMKVGGVIICSRYNITPHLRSALGLREGDPGPHEAIDTFVKMYGPYIQVIDFKGNYIMMRKRRE
jgi:predicted O-methyltransferase YrrM